MSTELWVPIPGWEWVYEVSDKGRVRSLDRISQTKGGYSRLVKGRVLAPKTSAGYLAVSLSFDGRVLTRRVHQLVALAFIGPCPKWAQVCHNNGDRSDNRAINLRYGTPKENSQDSVKHGVLAQQKKTHCKWGHLLMEPNLVVAHISRGKRQCRACNISRAQQQRGLHDDHLGTSNKVYMMIMTGGYTP